MPMVVDSHPQREKIIEALLNNESPRSIAAWTNPKLSHMAIYHYRNSKVTPAFTGLTEIANTLQAKIAGPVTVEPSEKIETVKEVTRTALVASPILERMEKRRLDRERILQKAEDEKDYRAWSSIDRNDITANELEARLTGQLSENRGDAMNINVALLIPRALEPAPLPKSQDVEFRQIGPEDPE